MGSDHQQHDTLEDQLRAALRGRAEAPGACPDRIGRYTVDAELGRGGMATVYLARDEKLQRLVALKLIRPMLQFDAEARRRFRREALAAARLDHPGICHLHEVGEHEGVPFMVMRYVPGRPFSALLAEKLAASPGHGGEPTAAGVMTAVHFIEKVARALHEAHELGLVHRDIKPGNLMITPEGEPVILDFGVAHDAWAHDQALTMTGQMLGTPLYMAPEQVTSAPGAVDRRTDVFSLALTLYEALTGVRPFEAPTQHEIFRKILRDDPVEARRLNAAVSRDLAIVLQTALRKEPSRRYRSAAEFAEDLRRVRERRPIAAKKPTTLERLSRWAARNPLAATAGLVLATALAVIGGLWRSASASDERSRLNQARFELAASTLRAEQLLEEHQHLFPSRRDMIPRLAAWLDRAEPLAAQRPRLRRELAATASGPANDELSRFLRRTLEELLQKLEALGEQDIPFVRERLEIARATDRVTLHESRAAWDVAIAAIADPAGKYEGLNVRPHVGLVPIGVDPSSGLQEFAVFGSGEIPSRNASGELPLSTASAIVLVLIPGGSFLMGSDHYPNGRPSQVVLLDPFFLGKFEITQAQWLRVMRSNPSRFHPERPFRARATNADAASLKTFDISLQHPVEGVTYDESATMLGRVDLELPTEAQWEYARDEVDSTAWPACLRGAANVNDRDLARFGFGRPAARWSDGYPCHAPVGSFRPNTSGLHDLIGNVGEWCRDWRGAYALPVAPGSGERLVPDWDRTARVYRPGSWQSDSLVWYQTVMRSFSAAEVRSDYIGLRAARALAP
ncbi:MAG: SUMF1/EgtB/PvdO family nonheme iron enzyme [Planctomycetota bacterium]